MRYRVMLLLRLASCPRFACSRSQQPAALPRFRAGANLVRVDTYVSKDNVALIDLKAEDFAVFEDDKPQQIESFSLIQARRPNPQTERTDPTTVRDMKQQAADAARLFTLFFDKWSVQVSGSYRARKPIIDTLDKVIGPDDLVGVMTPEMSPGSITYSRRTGSIERAVTDTWYWGAKNTFADDAARGLDSRLLLDAGHARSCRQDDRAAAGAGDAQRAGRTRRASRDAASRAQVRDGVHRRVGALPPRRKPVARRRQSGARTGSGPGQPADRRHREAGRARLARGHDDDLRSLRADADDARLLGSRDASSASCCSAPTAPTSASTRSMRAAWSCSIRRSSSACRRQSIARG